MAILIARELYPFCLLTYLIVLILASPEDDEKYVSKYGNHHFFSGIWEVYRKIHEDEPRMKNICDQAHKLTAKYPGTINMTAPAIRELHFHNSTKYNPIRFDLMIYTILKHNTSDGMPICYYLTKGLTQECMYYLRSLDEQEEKFMLDQYVCGITI